jgi:hypothetical protein
MNQFIFIFIAHLQHYKKYKGSFMVKIYGLFRFQYTSGMAGDKCWILIMGNTFPIGIKMDEVYDLKGRMPKPSMIAPCAGLVLFLHL